MDNERTVDSVIARLNGLVRSRQIMSPELWVEAAQTLNVLVGDEYDLLYNLEQEVAILKLKEMESSKSVAEAKARIEATNLYRQARRQKSKIDQVNELIRIAKLQARLNNDGIKNY